jgi:hypothetical protein
MWIKCKNIFNSEADYYKLYVVRLSDYFYKILLVIRNQKKLLLASIGKMVV